MNFSVCIDALFNDRDFIESASKIKKSGINTIEFWTWWDRDIDNILTVKNRLGINILGFCTRFISLTDASKREEYIEGIKESINIAKKIDAKYIITQVGNELPGMSRGEQHNSIVEGLKFCVPLLEKSGITLIFEPLNTLVDHKNYYLYSSDEAFEICDKVGSQNIKVLFDIYHQQIMEGNLISRITKNIEKIGHFHAAGNPGRHELDKGEINYKEVFKAIDEAGYKGHIGLEYFPVEDVVLGLRKLVE
jgi:hydroxypyruvate isomerase